MTVIGPTFPSCDCSDDPALVGDAVIATTIGPDNEGGALFIEPHLDNVEAFESLRCAECDHAFIEDGDIVDSRVNAEAIV